MNERCSWTESLGAYLLGGLDDRERLAIRAHVDGCAICSAELAELQPIARLVQAADFDEVRTTLEPSPALGAAVLASARRTERRQRWVKGGAFLAAAAVLLAVLGFVRTDDDAPPRGQRIQLIGSSGVKAWVELRSVPAGTYAVFHTNGLPAGKVYRMWFEDGSGTRVPLGSFRGVRGTWLVCGGTTAVTVRELAAVGASDESGATVLRAPISPGPTTTPPPTGATGYVP